MTATKIEWTDATWNPVVGCSIVSPGCTNCYAMKMAARIERMNPAAAHYRGLTEPSKAGAVWTGKVATAPDETLLAPLAWKKPRRVFVNSMSDLFHEAVPDEVIDRVFAVMALTPRHTYQVLTKRAGRMREWFAERWQGTPAQRINFPDGDFVDMAAGAETGRDEQVYQAASEIGEQASLIDPDIDSHWDEKENPKALQFAWPLPNVWLGVSTERQQEADERIPHLLATPAAKRFISAEPLLGPLDLSQYLYRLEWLIAGGESGQGARPPHPDWARSLRDQCKAAGVPYFWKQWGEWAPSSSLSLELRLNRETVSVLPDGAVREWQPDFPESRLTSPQMASMTRVGKKRAGAQLDGREHREFPA
jgi:protein gp37